MAPKSSRQPILELIKDHVALGNLDQLVSAGCDKNFLISTLSLLYETRDWDKWEDFTGLSLRKLKDAIGEFRKCAAMTESINLSHLGFILTHSETRHLLHLPKWLREYALVLEACTKCAAGGPKKRPWQNGLIGLLVRHVIEKTTKPHDKRVSSLLSVVLEKPDYDETAHKMWRMNHNKLLQSP